jgi:hypothetical protein
MNIIRSKTKLEGKNKSPSGFLVPKSLPFIFNFPYPVQDFLMGKAVKYLSALKSVISLASVKLPDKIRRACRS